MTYRIKFIFLDSIIKYIYKSYVRKGHKKKNFKIGE